MRRQSKNDDELESESHRLEQRERGAREKRRGWSGGTMQSNRYCGGLKTHAVT